MPSTAFVNFLTLFFNRIRVADLTEFKRFVKDDLIVSVRKVGLLVVYIEPCHFMPLVGFHIDFQQVETFC
jgi:hypothetical protein